MRTFKGGNYWRPVNTLQKQDYGDNKIGHVLDDISVGLRDFCEKNKIKLYKNHSDIRLYCLISGELLAKIEGVSHGEDYQLNVSIGDDDKLFNDMFAAVEYTKKTLEANKPKSESVEVDEDFKLNEAKRLLRKNGYRIIK